MGSSLYTRKQAVVNAVKARVLAELQEIQVAVVRLQARLWFVLWDTQGVVLVDFVPPGHTHTGRRKRLGLLKTGVVLQHDNAPPHTARQTREKVEEMGWELLQHPPYSPGFAPTDFRLFGPLKGSLGGTKFENNEHVQKHVLQFLRAADKDYTADFNRLGTLHWTAGRLCWKVTQLSELCD